MILHGSAMQRTLPMLSPLTPAMSAELSRSCILLSVLGCWMQTPVVTAPTNNRLCILSEVKEVVHGCYGYFGAMQSKILSAPENRSAICRLFSSYVECVEPDVYGCHDTHFRPLRQYTEDKDRITGPPYYCPIPHIMFNRTSWKYVAENSESDLWDMIGLRSAAPTLMADMDSIIYSIALQMCAVWNINYISSGLVHSNV